MKRRKNTTNYHPLDKRYDTQTEQAIDVKVLETFPYEYVGRKIIINIETDEFTTVCPWSGLPDFGTLRIDYIPDKQVIELRSLKYYLISFRNVGIYQEHLVNRILEDLIKVCKPKWMQITADYKVRGGINTVTSVEYKKRK